MNESKPRQSRMWIGMVNKTQLRQFLAAIPVGVKFRSQLMKEVGDAMRLLRFRGRLDGRGIRHVELDHIGLYAVAREFGP